MSDEMTPEEIERANRKKELQEHIEATLHRMGRPTYRELFPDLEKWAAMKELLKKRKLVTDFTIGPWQVSSGEVRS